MKFHHALVTGATSGIGEALARLLANEKIPLILVGRNSKKLSELKREFSKKTHVMTIKADLQKKKDRKKVVDVIHELHPNLVVNCAGYGSWGEIAKSSVEEQLAILETNVAALMELSVESAIILKKRREKGVILNIASTAGEMPTPGMTTYGATKAFVISFSRGMDLELEPHGIRVLVSRPGIVETKFSHTMAHKKISYKGRKFITMQPEVLAKKLWNQIQKQKRSNVPDWRYLPLIWSAKISPDKLKKSVFSKIFAYLD